MQAMAEVHAAMATLRGFASKLPSSADPLAPTSSVSLPSTSFSQDLDMFKNPSRVTIRAFTRIDTSAFDPVGDLVPSVLNHIATCLGIIANSDSPSSQNDVAKILDWTTGILRKVQEGFGNAVADSSSSANAQSDSPSRSPSSFDSPVTASTSSVSSSSFGNGFGASGGLAAHEGEVEEAEGKGKKRGRAHSVGSESSELSELEEGDRRGLVKRREMVKEKEEKTLSGAEDDDESRGVEAQEDQGGGGGGGQVTSEWRQTHQSSIYIGRRSMKVLTSALSTIDQYLYERRNHEPPLPDHEPLVYRQPFVSLYNKWHSNTSSSKSPGVGQGWQSLFKLAEEEGLVVEEFHTELRSIIATVRDGQKVDLKLLGSYVTGSHSDHAREALARRRKRVDAKLEPIYATTKPKKPVLKLVSAALQEYFESGGVPIRIVVGSKPNSVILQRAVALCGSKIHLGFGIKGRFDEEDEKAIQKLLVDVKATKPPRLPGRPAAKGTNTGGSITGAIRFYDDGYFLEASDQYSIPLVGLEDQVPKKIAPVFDEISSIFERLGEEGFWYVVEKEKGWTLDRSDHLLEETKDCVFVCRLKSGEGESADE